MDSNSFLGGVRNDIDTIKVMVFVALGVLVGLIFMVMIAIYLTWQNNRILIKNIEYIDSDNNINSHMNDSSILAFHA